jgi:hypothetical protein
MTDVQRAMKPSPGCLDDAAIFCFSTAKDPSSFAATPMGASVQKAETASTAF